MTPFMLTDQTEPDQWLTVKMTVYATIGYGKESPPDWMYPYSS